MYVEREIDYKNQCTHSLLHILTWDVNGNFIKSAEWLYVPVQHDPNLTDDSNSPWLS